MEESVDSSVEAALARCFAAVVWLEYSGHGRALFTYCESVFILAMD